MRLATILLVLTSGACVGPETATRPTDPQPQPALALFSVVPQVGFGGSGIDRRSRPELAGLDRAVRARSAEHKLRLVGVRVRHGRGLRPQRAAHAWCVRIPLSAERRISRRGSKRPDNGAVGTLDTNPPSARRRRRGPPPVSIAEPTLPCWRTGRRAGCWSARSSLRDRRLRTSAGRSRPSETSP